MIRQFYLANTKNKKIYLSPKIEKNCISFSLAQGTYNEKSLPGWNNRGNLICPCCGNITSSKIIKEESIKKGLDPIPLAIIWDGERGKEYTIPTNEEINFLKGKDVESYSPQEMMERNSGGGDTFSWGVTKWGDLFTNRQLNTINTFIKTLKGMTSNLGEDDYSLSIVTYLAVLIDRIILYNTSFGVYETTSEKVNRIFGRQAISMTFVYPESNPFCGIAGSAVNQLDLLIKVIESESLSQFQSYFFNASSGEKEQFQYKTIDSVITDPPYYNAIAYADISDFFYVWLKQSLQEHYPLIFSTPKTPKKDECTALKHHHDGNEEAAKLHFERKLTAVFRSIEHQTNGEISIMFAHQSTEAWTTLCNSILGSNMNIKSSWALDTELSTGIKTNLSTLESSVTVACTPSEKKGYISYKKVKRAIQVKVSEEVNTLYELGFRGADLLTACFGKAVSEFGNYEHVEKADGSEVTVAELLDLARTAAFTALVRDFASDELTRFYIGWLQVNGMVATKHDDAVKFVRSGTTIDINDLYAHRLLIKDTEGNTQHLASFAERTSNSLGIPQEGAPLIDKVHATMRFWADQNLAPLNALIARDGQDKNNEFWRVLVVLKELLPEGKDKEQVSQLLGNADTRIEKAKTSKNAMPEQRSLFDDTDY